jgi:hypothetical protein
MLFACFLSAFLAAVCLWGRSFRNGYSSFCGGRGRIKNKIVKLPIHKIFNAKLLKEIKIFNSLNLITATRRGVAVVYSEYITALLKNVKIKAGSSPYEKLFYCYACYILAGKIEDERIKRQLTKNMLFTLFSGKKIVKIIHNMKWNSKQYELTPAPPYKIWGNSFVDFSKPGFEVSGGMQRFIYDSYIKYKNKEIVIKNYENFYEIIAAKEQEFILIVDDDKADWDAQINRNRVICKNLKNGEVKSYVFCGDKFRLTTSILQKTDKLKIYVHFAGAVTISVNGGKRNLLLREETDFNGECEKLVAAAYFAKFVRGERLRERYKAAEKVIPSLRLLTLVYEITDAEILLSAIDNFRHYKKIAELFSGINIVFLYSSGKDFVNKLVEGFISRDDVTDLIKNKVFLFFCDRVTAANDAIYFLSKMKQAVQQKFTAAERAAFGAVQKITSGRAAAEIDNGNVTVNEIAAKSFPYTRKIVLQNTKANEQSVFGQVVIKFGGLSVVTKNGQNLCAVGVNSGRMSVYKLPQGLNINIKDEVLTNEIVLEMKTKLIGYEQKKFVIVKNEDVMTLKERTENLLNSVENICIKSDDKQFEKIFYLPIVGERSPQLMPVIKSAVRNCDKNLLVSVLTARNSLTADIWEYLITKVIGVRFRAGKPQVTANINLTGEYSLSFEFDNKPYTFNIQYDKQDSSVN